MAFLLGLRASQKPETAIVETPKLEIKEAPHLEAQPPSSSTESFYEVLKVIDGDTIDVNLDGEMERIRLIGINTPETVDPRKLVECFSHEASEKAKDILSGKRALLESDPAQGERDKYGRLLRYVFLEDGINFNLLMIREGYAYEYTYDLPYKYQAEFKQAQKYAEKNGLGLGGKLWGGPAPRPPPAGAPSRWRLRYQRQHQRQEGEDLSRARLWFIRQNGHRRIGRRKMVLFGTRSPKRRVAQGVELLISARQGLADYLFLSKNQVGYLREQKLMLDISLLK